jgi:hypothetical protein
VFAAGGNGKTIEFFGLGSDSQATGGYSVRKFSSLRIDQMSKVNCLRFAARRLFVADTSNDITVYDFN